MKFTSNIISFSLLVGSTTTTNAFSPVLSPRTSTTSIAGPAKVSNAGGLDKLQQQQQQQQQQRAPFTTTGGGSSSTHLSMAVSIGSS
jgi:hypothetical protein